VELVKCRDQILLCGDKASTLIAKKTVVANAINDLRVISVNNENINGNIKRIKKSAMDNKEKIIAKQKEESDFSDLIQQSKESIDDIKITYDESIKENKIFDICKFILSEEGVKSELINKLKSLLNNKINYYLDLMESTNTCIFDEYFAETIYNKYGKEKSYDAFSGGEQKRFDLAILLAFQDILKDQSGIDIRLGFYDEILDSSIDESGRQRVLEILKDKAEATPIYVISHRRKMSDLIDKEIILEKHNDFTYIKSID